MGTPPVPATTRIAPTPPLPKSRRHRWLFIHWIAWGVVGAVLLWMVFNQRKAVVGIPPVEVAQPTPSPRPAPTKAPEDENVYTTDVDGQEFRVHVIAKFYSWEPISTTNITNIGNIMEKGKDSFTPQLQAMIKSAPEVLAMGTADYRYKNIDDEADRASKRVNNVATSILVPLKGGNEDVVHTLNLGKWIGCEDENPSYNDQRRIIIVEMWNRDKSKPLKFALRKALEKILTQEDSSIIKQVLNCYDKSHNFDVK